MSGPHFTPWRRLSATCLAVTTLAAACGGPTPTPDTSRTLHFENRTSQAVIVSVVPDDSGPSYDSAVRPCGGELNLILGRDGIPADRWQVFLVFDPGGMFDAQLAGWMGDPHDMSGAIAGLRVFWSRSDAVISAPQWITITPANVLASSIAPSASPSVSCGPIEMA
jgi:hypothetical protein